MDKYGRCSKCGSQYVITEEFEICGDQVEIFEICQFCDWRSAWLIVCKESELLAAMESHPEWYTELTLDDLEELGIELDDWSAWMDGTTKLTLKDWHLLASKQGKCFRDFMSNRLEGEVIK